MYFKEPDKELTLFESKTGLLAVIVSSILVILIGIVPGSILQLITSFI
jgi:hypothetical protein